MHRDIKPGNILLRAADGSAGAGRLRGGAPGGGGAQSLSYRCVDTGVCADRAVFEPGAPGAVDGYLCVGGCVLPGVGREVPDEAMDRIRQDPMISITEAAKGKATESFLSAVDWSLRVEEADRPQGVRVWRSALLGEEKVPEPVTEGTTRQTQQAPATGKDTEDS